MALLFWEANVKGENTISLLKLCLYDTCVVEVYVLPCQNFIYHLFIIASNKNNIYVCLHPS
jgi:hypothetical protein